MKIDLSQNPSGFRRLKGFVKRSRSVRVEVIQGQFNDLRSGITLLHQPLHLLCEIEHRAPLGDLDVPQSGLWLDKQKEVSRAVAFILVIVARWLTGPGWYRRARLYDQLLACLIKVDLRALRVIRRGVQIQGLLHRRDELATDRRDAPLLFQPGLEFVFLSARRTVSSEIVSTTFNSTRRSASNCIVQRARPSGASLQASAIKRAFALTSSLGFLPGRGRSLRAPRPRSTKLSRVRSTVARPTPSASAICSSVHPAAALSRIRARVSFRDECFPERSNC